LTAPCQAWYIKAKLNSLIELWRDDEMAESKIPVWQNQVEEILKAKGVSDGLPALVKSCNAILAGACPQDPPTDMVGTVMLEIIKTAVAELPPLSAAYTAFALGRGYERWHNESRA
jgi:hypothetical protein